MKTIYLYIILFVLIAGNSTAMVNTSTFWSYWGTYDEISGGTLLGSGTALDDDTFNALEIGFNFTFNGTAYTQFSVNANGFLALGSSVSSSYAPLSTGTSNNVISALGFNLQGNPAATLRYALTGTAGSRVLTVQWKDFRYTGVTGDQYNFQIRLYETTNEVTLVYGNFIKNAATRFAQVGLRGASNADFSNRVTTNNWLATTAGGNNTVICYLSNASLPPDGLTYCFTPTVAGLPLLPSGPAPANNVANVPVNGSIAWTFGSGTVSYDLWFGPKGNMTKVVDNQPVGAGSFNYSPPPINTSITYQWQVFEHNGAGTINGPVWSFTTVCGANAVPFTENFDSYPAPGTGCSTILNVNGDAVKWQTKPGEVYNGINRLHIGYNPAGQSHNDWYITPELTLVGMLSYDVKFYYKGGGLSYVENLEVKWGDAPSVAGMSSPAIFSDISFYKTAYTLATASFTPPVTGSYYIGWHCFSLGDQFGIDVDQITVTTTPCDPPAPAASIAGETFTAQGRSGMAYSVASVPGATGYLWTLPAGASIATGTNTNSITVDFSLAAASGNMSVSTTNSCGSGTASPPLFIRVLPQVSTLENISVANGSTACYDAVQTIIVAGNGSSFSVLPGGSVTMIAGQSIACMPGTSVQPGGYLHGYITTNNEYCGAMVLPAMAVVSDVSEHNSSLVRSLFRIYPNPASDYLIIELAGEGQFPNTRVEVYGMDGVKVYSGVFAGEKSHTIPLTSLLPGVYVIHVVFGLDAGTVKMIKL